MISGRGIKLHKKILMTKSILDSTLDSRDVDAIKLDIYHMYILDIYNIKIGHSIKFIQYNVL